MSQAWMPKVAQGFDQLAWRQSLRGSPVMRKLASSEWAVLWHAFDHADGLGEVDLPAKYIAGQYELSERSVRRGIDALAKPVEQGGRGLLVQVRRRSGSAVNRYRLAVPAGAPACSDERDEGLPRSYQLPHEGDDTGVHMTPVSPPTGHQCPVEHDTGVTQSNNQSNAAAAGAVSSGRAEPVDIRGAGGLFAGKPAFDRGAVRYLESLGFTRHSAASQVSKHGLTRQQAHAVRMNIRAAQRAGVRARSSWVAFAKWMIKQGEFAWDQRVQDEIDARRLRARRRAARAQAQRVDEAARAEADRRAAALRAAAAWFDGLDAGEQRRLMDAQRPAVGDGALPIEPGDGRLRQWAIEELAEQTQKGAGDA